MTASNKQLDFTVVGATVFDGLQTEPQDLTVGVRGAKIAYVGPASSAPVAARVFDASTLYLCPGFVDTHASTGLGYRFPNAADHKLFQGVTTEIIGNCGTSPGPVGDPLVPTMEQLASEIGFEFDWRTLGEWFEGVEAHGLPINVGTFIGHATLRGGVCADNRAFTPAEIDSMCAMADEAMVEGALGLSTGLVYAPGSFAETDEIVALARVASRRGGIYVSHLRDEREGLEAAVEEALQIASAADLPVLISHLKAGERPNWGKLPPLIEHIDAARDQGLDVAFEVYPYTAASTKLRTFIPKDMLREGISGMRRTLSGNGGREQATSWLQARGTDFSGMVLITANALGQAGESVADVADNCQRHPADTVVDLMLEDPDTWIVYHCMDEADMDAAITWHASNICSDSWSYPVNAPRQIGHPHPRTYGAFTRFLERYSLRRQRLSFGEAVRKISSFPADRVGLSDRGRISENCYADLVLLDPRRVREMATYTDPRQFSEGTEYVWVNGELMLERGMLHDKHPGMAIRGH